MAALLSAQSITTAVSASASDGVDLEADPGALLLVIDFVYGSGGTSGKVWVQTSVDGGTTWIDVACMTFTTASKKRIHNLSAKTAVTTPYDPLDGTLSDDSVKDGLLGRRYRTKRTTIGTYAGASTLTVLAIPKP